MLNSTVIKYWRLRTTIILCSLVIIAVGFMDFSFSTPNFSVLLPSPSPEVAKNTPRPAPSSVPLSPELVTDVVNAWRTQEGLSPYTESKSTCEIAALRLPEIQKVFSHEGFYKYPPRYTSTEKISENLGRDYFFAEDAPRLLNDWLNSPSHSMVLRTTYTKSCIKCANGYCVQIFANF